MADYLDQFTGSSFTCFLPGTEPPKSTTSVALVDPVSGREWATAGSNPLWVDLAVDAAARAFRSGAWSAKDPSERAKTMWRMAELVEQNAEELASLEVLACGKTLRTTRNEIARTAAWWRYFGGAADKLDGKYINLSPTAEARVRYDPVGVVAAITPFNGTISLGTWKLAPALAAGNSVVVKPPIEAPGATLLLARLAAEAGIPDGVLTVVPGGPDIGAALVDHAHVNMVSFTGSTAVARRIGAAAVGGMKRFVCEAGGKSAQIIFDDADLEAALIQARQGVFSNTGQSCVAGSRLLLHRSVFDQFVERLRQATGTLVVGNPFEAPTHVGPLASAKQFARVDGLVRGAVDGGAHALTGGAAAQLPAPMDQGFFYLPTILSDVTSASEVWKEEVFGPVTIVRSFGDEDEAIELANDSAYGLAAALWTNDIRRSHRVSRQLEAGTVWINTYRMMNYRVPFGGIKQSGLGRENGQDAIREFVNTRSIVSEAAPPVDAFDY